ncbi:hypothetical protein V498_03004 [Pseudogymnoascus sp. VKM F-4517 (FW-2822)]|nr:hypothetical protein V498_03004 [Pseudogymnoascus sp. VKM F-4517 (FW-2822)]
MCIPGFLSEELQQGPPLSSWADFKASRLRQYPHYKEEITFYEVLGSGVDGTVLKVCFGDGEPVAMKVFYHTRRPNPIDGIIRYWPFERECRNMSLIEKVKYGIEQSSPIYLRSKISTRDEAIQNLFAFSTEGCRKNIFQAVRETESVSSIPDMTNCHGWVKVPGETLPSRRLRRRFDPSFDFYAIVYDFVSPSNLQVGIVQAQLDFFYVVGFSIETLKADNWEGKGLLVDFCDILSPLDRFWCPSLVKCEVGAMFTQR